MTDSEYQYYFHAGTLQTAYEYLGCHYDRETKRATFRVWAPHATSVSVVGDFSTNQDYMPYIHNLTENTIKGNLYMSIFGSGTCNSEFDCIQYPGMGPSHIQCSTFTWVHSDASPKAISGRTSYLRVRLEFLR